MNGETPRPLSRNREYNLLWSSYVVSQLGSQATLFAYPVLVLFLTGSAIQAALVEFAIAGARLVAGLPSGALVDRWNRKRVLLAGELVRALALGSLAVAIGFGHTHFAHILAVAVVEGVFMSLFAAAEQAMLPMVVPRKQLPTAVARNSARYHVATVVGPGLGGVLLSAGRMFPFAANAIGYLVSFVALLFLRAPEQPARTGKGTSVAREMTDGLRWILRHPRVRSTLVLAAVFNLIFSALLFVAIASSQRAGVDPGEIGLIGVLLGAGGILGAIAAPRLRTAVPPYLALVALLWLSAALVPLLAIVPVGVWLGVVLGGIAFLAPTATTIVSTYQMLITPDELRGRLAGAIGVFMGVAGALGPLAGGVLVESGGRGPAVYGCAAAMVVLAIAVTASPTMRTFPASDEYAGDPVDGDAPEAPAKTAVR
ncbi:MFS transporter [Amycolatopsis antarctica]|uniref:MFS transporter n=1 Tax=Amycolatopsis antarctica TaxID=1854586 RepID=A0A263D554_9PSEU|nr:MFS transporter [Amycolatopsis antarctica]OZM73590.1 MFS transporter [Amycolatopsis antarctica]